MLERPIGLEKLFQQKPPTQEEQRRQAQHRREKRRKTQTDLEWADLRESHKKIVHKLMRDLRGPSGT